MLFVSITPLQPVEMNWLKIHDNTGTCSKRKFVYMAPLQPVEIKCCLFASLKPTEEEGGNHLSA